MHKIHIEEEVILPNSEDSSRSFDSVRMMSLTLHRLTSVTFAKLESCKAKDSKIVYKIHTGSDGNVMLF